MLTGGCDVTDHQVLQRGPDGSASVDLGSKFVELRVMDAGEQPVVDWTGSPRARIPCGGPYLLTGRRSDRSVVPIAHDVFVGDVWILGGQSNMEGVGLLDDQEPPSDAVRVFGMDRRWHLAEEPLHRLWRSPDWVHHWMWTEEQRADIDPSQLVAGAGLGVAFANEMVRLTGIPIGLVPVAHGGTSMQAWSPDKAHLGGDSLYGSMMDSVRAAGGRVAGMLWYQGESDCESDEQADDYRRASREMFDALRRDLDQPTVPIFLAQLNLFPTVDDHDAARRWTQVRMAQNDLDALGAQGLVATTDLSRTDPIHLDTPSLRRLGRRFARVASGQVESIRVSATDVERRRVDVPDSPPWFDVCITFGGLSGGLRPGEQGGFSLRTTSGDPVAGVWRAHVDHTERDRVMVHVATRDEDTDLELWYGWGTDSFCTLVDDADQAVPAFGPIPLA